MEENLARTLSDILSFIVAKDFRSAANQAQQVIADLYQKLLEVKSNFSESSTETFDRLCLNIATFLSQLNQKQDLHLANFIHIDPQFLEQDSFQILKTAHKVLDLLESEHNATFNQIVEETYDWTPGVICLSKVFEKEINLSVVHAIRQYLGVTLPAFFDKFQPGCTARFGNANFNKVNNNGGWLPPGVGQSEFACRNMTIYDGSPIILGWSQAEFNLLMNKWANIRIKRNNAAHTVMVDRDSVSEIKNSLEELSGGNIFEKLYQMKRYFRGN